MPNFKKYKVRNGNKNFGNLNSLNFRMDLRDILFRLYRFKHPSLRCSLTDV